jgi:hypothetical protein
MRQQQKQKRLQLNNYGFQAQYIKTKLLKSIKKN